jgi:hypothetical protein
MASFYIYGIHFGESNTKIEKLTGYLTDAKRGWFYPARDYSRKLIISKIKTGDIFFLGEDCYSVKVIEIIKFKGVEFLRVDNNAAPFDFFG